MSGNYDMLSNSSNSHLMVFDEFGYYVAQSRRSAISIFVDDRIKGMLKGYCVTDDKKVLVKHLLVECMSQILPEEKGAWSKIADEEKEKALAQALLDPNCHVSAIEAVRKWDLKPDFWRVREWKPGVFIVEHKMFGFVQ